MKTVVNPVFEEILIEIILKQPNKKDLFKFCTSWFQNMDNKQKDDL